MRHGRRVRVALEPSVESGPRSLTTSDIEPFR